MNETVIRKYREIADSMDREFQRNRRLHGKKILCAAGCTGCCHHLFSITEIEAAAISRAVRRMPPNLRPVLVAKARAYEPARHKIMRRHGFIQARGNLPSPETRLACPALVDGKCAIYESRPLICRKYGMPLLHPDRPGRTFACELNFQRGEAIHDTQLVTIQTELNTRCTGLQEGYDHAGGRRAELPISVARAIMEDFEQYLP